jgi:hypothetical protein
MTAIAGAYVEQDRKTTKTVDRPRCGNCGNPIESRTEAETRATPAILWFVDGEFREICGECQDADGGPGF